MSRHMSDLYNHIDSSDVVGWYGFWCFPRSRRQLRGTIIWQTINTYCFAWLGLVAVLAWVLGGGTDPANKPHEVVFYHLRVSHN